MTKLPEPVQVGLWYETKAGAIVKMEKQDGDSFYANNDEYYLPNGSWSSNRATIHDLIRCLGSDPFKPCGETDMTGALSNILKPQPTTPTQFERILTAVMSAMLSNSSKNGGVADLVEQSKRITQEAIKQLKEIEGA